MEDKKKPLVIHVYRDMLRQAEIFRQAIKHNKGAIKEHYESISQELYYWCGELEKTPEVNPPRQTS